MYDQLARYIQNQIYIGADDLQMILSCFKPVKLARNELLLRQGKPSQRLPNKFVASYLNISQETLSRLKTTI